MNDSSSGGPPAGDEPEIWMPVVNYEGLYFVSDLGRVWSVKRSSTSGVILKPWIDSNGRPVVKLSKQNVEKNRHVHRIVADAFLGPLPEGQETRHKDDNSLNSTLANLEYGTSAENKEDQKRNHGHYQWEKTHCPRNHPYDEVNTRIRMRNGHPSRDCRACGAERSAERALRLRETGEAPCTEDGCSRPIVAKGLCSNHYDQMRRALRPPKVCELCGAEFPGSMGPKRFCGPECAKEAARILRKANRNAA